MARAFHGLRVVRDSVPTIPDDQAAIVYSNHPSWWDPAFFIVLRDRLFPNRHGFGPMDADALQHYRFMRRIGVFGIEAERYRGAARFLRVARGLLAEPKHMLWLTAQGEFTDPRQRPARLRGGVARLMAEGGALTAVPLALDYPFWSESRPEALARFGPPLIAKKDSVDNWQHRLETALTDTQDALAADAIARDPTPFDTVIPGSAGVGGIYDLARRLRAAFRGKRFSAEHQPEDHRQ